MADAFETANRRNAEAIEMLDSVRRAKRQVSTFDDTDTFADAAERVRKNKHRPWNGGNAFDAAGQPREN